MRPRVLAAGAALFAIAILAPTAAACSCAVGNPRYSLASADAAFIGTLISRGEPTSREIGEAVSSNGDVDYRFRVDERIKGELGDEIVVRASASGSSCGIEVLPGETTGLFLRRDATGWRSGLCSMIEPAALRSAAEATPAADGRGPPRLLIASVYPGYRMMALDAEARTLAYGAGEGEVVALDPCRGNDVVAEIFAVTVGGRKRYSVSFRDMDTLDPRGGFPLVGFTSVGIDDPRQLRAVRCLDDDGESFVIEVYTDGLRAPRETLVRFDMQRPTTIYDERAWAIDLHRERPVAFVAEADNRLAEIDLSAGDRRFRGRLPDGVRTVVASSDGSHVAGKTVDGEYYVHDVVGNRSVVRPIAGRSPVWLTDRTFAVPDDGRGVTVYDTMLRTVSEWHGWGSSRYDVAIAGTLYGFGGGRVRSAPATAGPERVLRGFGVENVYPFEPVLPNGPAQKDAARSAGVAERPRASSPPAVSASGSKPASSGRGALVVIAGVFGLVAATLAAAFARRSV